MSSFQSGLNQLRQMTFWKYVSARVVVLGVLGIVLLIIGSSMGAKESTNLKPVETLPINNVQKAAPATSYEEALENKLAYLLSQVKGAGKVSINIAIESDNIQEYAKNMIKESKTIQEKDSTGGLRTTTEVKETEQMVLSKEAQGGADRPVIVKQIKPTVKGVLVIAEGADDSVVKAKLIRAVESSLDIPAHKIAVMAQRK